MNWREFRGWARLAGIVFVVMLPINVLAAMNGVIVPSLATLFIMWALLMSGLAFARYARHWHS